MRFLELGKAQRCAGDPGVQAPRPHRRGALQLPFLDAAMGGLLALLRYELDMLSLGLATSSPMKTA
jgi:hypothetical protein